MAGAGAPLHAQPAPHAAQGQVGNGPESGQSSELCFDCCEACCKVVDARVDVWHRPEKRGHVSLELPGPVRLVPHLLCEEIQSVAVLRERIPRFIPEFTHLPAKFNQRLQGQVGHDRIVLLPRSPNDARAFTKSFYNLHDLGH